MKQNNKILSMITYLGVLFTYLILDVGMRYLLWKKVGFVSYTSVSPLAFSISYGIIILICMFLFSKRAKLIYIISTIIFNIYCLAQMIHFRIFTNFFALISLFSAGEAKDYLGYALSQINIYMLLICLLSVISLIIVLFIKKKTDTNYFMVKKKKRALLVLVIVFILFRVLAIYKLGKPVPYDNWDNWDTPRNVYNDYGNKNRSMMVSGMYEYLFRDIYLYLKNYFDSGNKEKLSIVDEYMKDADNSIYDNEYTGIFKDKNLIMIMLESIDSWLVDSEVMPTMSYLAKTGLNFTNRYAPFFGGGMTIGSEFSSLSGLYSISKQMAIYNYSNNNFKYDLPTKFLENGYLVNSMHMNYGDFYNRNSFHKALGFTNHYSLKDMKIPGDITYDTNMILQDDSYNLIVNPEKFMTFIITYSAHVPYLDNPMCDDLGKKYPNIVSDDLELSCLKLLAHETDDFLKLLLERLKEDDYLDDTVIVLFTDHYSYGFPRTSEMKQIEDANLIQKTPFIIWSSDIEAKNIDTIMDTTDIPLTLFNMFGISYEPKLYMGTDVFSKNHENFVYFSDYTWYDGSIYSKNAKIDDYYKKITNIVNKKIDINEKIISSNYYNYYEKGV